MQLSIDIKQTQYDRHLGFILRKIRDQGKIFKTKPGKICTPKAQAKYSCLCTYSFSFSDNFSGRNLVWMKRGDSRAIKIKTEDQIWSLFGDDVKKEVLKHGKNHKFEF